ncbi:bifunctional pyr operon transcriptional regulator/uracil phosphoribosyltransferase PyrR [Balneatrix alpica]|uniref:Bifunctional pyr operon transcriptional regulator/uracil phosphoribosyltransferase PyrR n=1 Tax=Balneatrix alpica TaxID=75684 RepID=A0ABV5ZFD2_9GAMM|nr:bifunctional pyr operon transcriptional regulator/uracil phosphoribosyltransferase PyrR [Balneatrix alpica]
MSSAPMPVDGLLDKLRVELKCLLEEKSISQPVMIGIRTGGVWIAERLHQALALEGQVGVLDISFYRDDFTRIGLHPRVQPSSLPFALEDQHIILVDDVIMSGRTIRAALNELFDYGRPASVTLVTLFDIGQRELPLQPDLVGQRLQLEPEQQIKLTGPTPLGLEIISKAPSL